MPYRDRPRTRTERLAESFVADPRYENLITMTPERRETVLHASPLVRTPVGR